MAQDTKAAPSLLTRRALHPFLLPLVLLSPSYTPFHLVFFPPHLPIAQPILPLPPLFSHKYNLDIPPPINQHPPHLHTPRLLHPPALINPNPHMPHRATAPVGIPQHRAATDPQLSRLPSLLLLCGRKKRKDPSLEKNFYPLDPSQRRGAVVGLSPREGNCQARRDVPIRVRLRRFPGRGELKSRRREVGGVSVEAAAAPRKVRGRVG